MGRAKDIVVKPISSSDAQRVIKALHYSHKVVNNSQLHFGVFLDDKCGGALSFGPSLDKRKIIGLVEGTGWNEFLELNRMALADWLPKNGESRVLSVCLHLIKKNYPPYQVGCFLCRRYTMRARNDVPGGRVLPDGNIEIRKPCHIPRWAGYSQNDAGK